MSTYHFPDCPGPTVTSVCTCYVGRIVDRDEQIMRLLEEIKELLKNDG